MRNILCRPWRHLTDQGPVSRKSRNFSAPFGWQNSLCIFKTKASRGTKLCSYFYFYSLYNIWEDQLYRISRPEFDEWLFGPEKLSGLSRNRPQVWWRNGTTVNCANSPPLLIKLNQTFWKEMSKKFLPFFSFQNRKASTEVMQNFTQRQNNWFAVKLSLFLFLNFLP